MKKKKKKKNANYSPPPASRLMLSHSSSNGHFRSQTSAFFLPLPQFLLVSTTSYVMEYRFHQFSSPVLVCPFPDSCPPQVYSLEARRGKKRKLDAVQALFSNSQNSNVLWTVLATNANHRIRQAAMNKVNFIPFSPKTVIKNVQQMYILEYSFTEIN